MKCVLVMFAAGNFLVLPDQIQTAEVQQCVHLPWLGLRYWLVHGLVLHGLHPAGDDLEDLEDPWNLLWGTDTRQHRLALSAGLSHCTIEGHMSLTDLPVNSEISIVQNVPTMHNILGNVCLCDVTKGTDSWLIALLRPRVSPHFLCTRKDVLAGGQAESVLQFYGQYALFLEIRRVSVFFE